MSARHLPVLREKQKSFSKSWKYSIFLGPVVTQKAYSNTVNRIYTVKVHLDATKISIAAAFKDLFGITPVAINTVTLPGKTKSKKQKIGNSYKEILGKTAKIKKAMIKIPEGVDFDFGAE